jgi:hydrogenase maturation protease
MAGEARRVVVGIGNPILTDDAAGLLLAREVRRRLGRERWDLIELAAGGLEIMEAVLGYEQAVVIDSIVTGRGAPGDLYLVDSGQGASAGREPAAAGEEPNAGNGEPASEQGEAGLRSGDSSHQIGLLEGLDLGRRLGLAVPENLRLYALEVADPFTFGTRLTRGVEESIPDAAARIAIEVVS